MSIRTHGFQARFLLRPLYATSYVNPNYDLLFMWTVTLSFFAKAKVNPQTLTKALELANNDDLERWRKQRKIGVPIR